MHTMKSKIAQRTVKAPFYRSIYKPEGLLFSH